jgi:hypothetical protein
MQPTYWQRESVQANVLGRTCRGPIGCAEVNYPGRIIEPDACNKGVRASDGGTPVAGASRKSMNAGSLKRRERVLLSRFFLCKHPNISPNQWAFTLNQ